MKISKREANMVLLVVAVVLGVSTFLFGEARWVEWKEVDEIQARLEEEIALDERMLEQAPAWNAELAELMEQLRTFPAVQQVAPQLMEQVNEMARRNGLNLPSQSPETERESGYIFETALRCQFQGTLEALVRFLFELQSAGAHFNVRNITVAPTGQGEELRGNVTVDCVYLRTGT